LDSGNVQCWGQNANGQLGDGNTSGQSTTPVGVFISNVEMITAGDAHTCGVLDSGSLQCWGNNNRGQLGNGATSGEIGSPTNVINLVGDTVIGIAAGEGHTCALIEGGTVKCWGWNNEGQLGRGTTGGEFGVPGDVTGLTNVTSIKAGGRHTCALLESGEVRCWGRNNQGQLGNGANADSDVPVSVSGLTNVTAITGGNDHTCALLDSNEVRCWGENGDGQLGNNSTTDSNIPVSVDSSLGVALEILDNNLGGSSCAIVSL
jgi:alpha-tubulin suppressor-like RCC1 family protein